MQSSIEVEDWGTVRSGLKNNRTADDRKKRSLKIYRRQMSALHLACQHNPPIDIVKSLLESNPNAARQRSQPRGEIPLHFATSFNAASVEVIRELVQAKPSTVTAMSTIGVTPLHQACIFRAPYETIRIMVDACPEAVHIEDSQGRTPFDIAKATYFLFNPICWRILYLLSGGNTKRIKGVPYVFPTENKNMNGGVQYI